MYTKLLLTFYKWGFFSRRVPTPRHDMDPNKMKPKQQLQRKQVAYAVNIRVPIGAEEEFSDNSRSVTGFLGTIVEENLHRLPFKVRPGEFERDEDPVAYVMHFVGDVYPPIHSVWREKCSDEAMTQMAFYGLGAHRLQVVVEDGPLDASTKQPIKTKLFVVATNQLSQLPVREGLEHYGGDAFFCFDTWRVQKIVIRNQAEPWQKSHTVVRPGDAGWEYAKFRWRSSLFTLVTLVDHLFGIHFQISNSVTVAMRQQLSKEHPFRRFLTPFCFQTISVNNNARNNLVNPRTMGPRCFALTDAGTDMAFSAAPTLLHSGLEVDPDPASPKDLRMAWKPLVDRGYYIEKVLKPKLGGKLTPYYEQVLAYWKVLKTFVGDYMKAYWSGPTALAKCREAVQFILQCMSMVESAGIGKLISSIPFNPEGGMSGLDPDLLWELTLNLVTRHCELVTAGHEQVGAVQEYAQDASFCAFSWSKGKLAGTKQAAVNAAVLMSFTSTPMPRLMQTKDDDDWSFLFLDAWSSSDVHDSRAKAVAAYRTFQSSLAELAQASDEFNAKALAPDAQFPNNFGIWSINPKFLEVSVSV